MGSAGLDRMLLEQMSMVAKQSYHHDNTYQRAATILHIEEAKLPGEQRRTRKKKAKVLEEREQPPRQSYMVKMIWRYPQQKSEGEILQGVFGLTRHMWYMDAAGGVYRETPLKDRLAECADDRHWQLNARSLKSTDPCGKDLAEQQVKNNGRCAPGNGIIQAEGSCSNPRQLRSDAPNLFSDPDADRRRAIMGSRFSRGLPRGGP